MSKRKYRAVWVKDVDASKLASAFEGERCVVAIDVAKTGFFAAVMDVARQVHVTVKWLHPEQSGAFMAFVASLAEVLSVEVAMEPSGVYGDAIRSRLWSSGFEVHRVNPKRAHDAAEVYDGVPSWHDAKSAAVIGKLHLDGASESWPIASDHERRLAAALRVLEVHAKEVQRNCNRLEGYLARHWPEVGQFLKRDSATLLELLKAYGGPAAVAADPDGARELMRRVGGQFLAQEKIDGVVNSASRSFGMPQIEEERHMVMAVAGEARRQQQAAKVARNRVEQLSGREGASAQMAPVVGRATAAVLTASVGDATKYATAAAYEKALGLNLKEKSSGTLKGALHVTKRGPGVSRLYLYMAVLRLIQTDPVVRAWYAKKVQRDGGRKQKALVAIMRKLARALWHVAHGEPFDSSKLFDVTRLKLQMEAAM